MVIAYVFRFIAVVFKDWKKKVENIFVHLSLYYNKQKDCVYVCLIYHDRHKDACLLRGSSVKGFCF